MEIRLNCNLSIIFCISSRTAVACMFSDESSRAIGQLNFHSAAVDYYSLAL